MESSGISPIGTRDNLSNNTSDAGGFWSQNPLSSIWQFRRGVRSPPEPQGVGIHNLGRNRSREGENELGADNDFYLAREQLAGEMKRDPSASSGTSTTRRGPTCGVSQNFRGADNDSYLMREQLSEQMKRDPSVSSGTSTARRGPTCGVSQNPRDDKCTLPNNLPGICKKISSCTTFDEDTAAGPLPEICNFDPIDSLPIVCCRQAPPKPLKLKPTPKKRISERMCEKYAEFVYTKSVTSNHKEVKKAYCGHTEEPLIIGGTNAELKEFPHMVQIGFGEDPSISWSCGGSLISDHWVLTAAHCKTHSKKGIASWARVGELDSDNDDDGGQPKAWRIVDHRTHPQPDSPLYDDIALFKLEKAIKLSPYVRPICLQVDAALKSDTMIATGWGRIVWGGRATSHLQKIKINVVNNKTCRQAYANSDPKQLPNGIEQSKQLCAGNEYNKDTCQGDSGGPLQYRLATPYCMYSQVGVTSFGRACGSGSPGVYTRVSFYIDWIESIVWPGQ